MPLQRRRRRRHDRRARPRRAAAAPPAAAVDGRRPVAAVAAVRWHAGAGDFAHPFAVEVSEVAHDPELDEAVIAFANADFEQCEQALVATSPAQGGAARAACRDLAGAVRPVPRHRPAAQVREPGAGLRAAVRLVGAAVVLACPSWSPKPPAKTARPAAAGIDGQVGWVCPDYLDADARGASCRRRRLQMPLPWVFDWGALRNMDRRGGRPAVASCSATGSAQQLDMRWLGGERLFAVLQDAAPTGVRDADPAYWQLRLDALRMANRPDQFDEAAIDYCVTYEVSPPSWEPRAVRGARQRLAVQHHLAAAVDGQRGVDQLHRVAASTKTPASRCRWPASNCPASWSATSAPTLQATGRRARQLDHRQRVVRAADPRRLHRRRRPAQLGAGTTQREPQRQSSSSRTAWWRCSSARWASTSTPG